MEVKDEILRYIQNEKDISRYKISTLERRSNIPPSQKRILNIEKEFLGLPLETMEFEDVADVAAAISIYSTSRSLFYKTYDIRVTKSYEINKAALLDVLNKKVDFIESTAHTLVRTRVQELNLVQNSDFYYDFARRQSLKNGTTIDLEKRNLDAMGLKELLNVEPLTIAKKRARSQAATYSMAHYLLKGVEDITVSSNMNLEALIEINKELDGIVGDIKYNIFKHYNDGLKILPKLLKGTMGENPYLLKLHELQNVLDFSNLKKFGDIPKPIANPVTFRIESPMLGNIFFGSKKAIAFSPEKDSERNVQNKVFGILLPIPRKGNEKMSLLYKEIKIDGFDASHLFSDSLSNVKAMQGGKEVYYKGVLMFPLWKIIAMASTDNTSRHILFKIVNFNKSSFQSINFNDTDMINKINNAHTDFIDISSDSKILTAKTRSEEEGLSDIFSIVNSRVSEINDDYSKLVATTNEILLD